MITHVIYHIPGRKVGCTKNLDDRKLRYLGREGSVPEFKILEELHNKNDQEAGDIEWQWADKFGYRRGTHYTVTTVSMRGGQVFGPTGRKMTEVHKAAIWAGYREKFPEKVLISGITRFGTATTTASTRTIHTRSFR